jgi:hypothetical protein
MPRNHQTIVTAWALSDAYLTHSELLFAAAELAGKDPFESYSDELQRLLDRTSTRVEIDLKARVAQRGAFLLGDQAVVPKTEQRRQRTRRLLAWSISGLMCASVVGLVMIQPTRSPVRKKSVDEMLADADVELRERSRTTQRTTSPNQLQVQELPYGLQRFQTVGNRIAPLSIKASPGSHFYVKLVHAVDGSSAAQLFVPAGETVSIKMPLGEFELRYASGTTWYGERDHFGPSAPTYKAVEKFNFERYGEQIRGYTIELILQENGNLRTDYLNPSAF